MPGSTLRLVEPKLRGRMDGMVKWVRGLAKLAGKLGIEV
jgi:hypothetical protein